MSDTWHKVHIFDLSEQEEKTPLVDHSKNFVSVISQWILVTNRILVHFLVKFGNFLVTFGAFSHPIWCFACPVLALFKPRLVVSPSHLEFF